jgi:hypothetical protein
MHFFIVVLLFAAFTTVIPKGIMVFFVPILHTDACID